MPGIALGPNPRGDHGTVLIKTIYAVVYITFGIVRLFYAAI